MCGFGTPCGWSIQKRSVLSRTDNRGAIIHRLAQQLPVYSRVASHESQEKENAMKAKNILFPTDFSHSGDAALELATSLARDSGATLLIVHVEEPPVAYGGGELYYGIPDPNTDQLAEMLEKVVPTDPAVPHEHKLITGSPIGALLKLAKNANVDMIVMGTHGRTGLTRLLMGSVAEAIVQRAPCPVLTYKQPVQSSAGTS
jgi:nucleotide-binding universal stress UspA family protein